MSTPATSNAGQRFYNYYKHKYGIMYLPSSFEGPALQYDCKRKRITHIELVGFDRQLDGFLLRLPKDLSGKFHLPGAGDMDEVEVVNLWKCVSLRANVGRILPWIGIVKPLKFLLVVGGDFSAGQLEDFVLSD